MSRAQPPRSPLVVVLALMLFGCIDPQDRRPGLRLTGEVHQGPVEDWSFSDAHREIFLEVRTPYWIPHSMTIVCASDGEMLYVGARNPERKRWVGYVARDPEVRLKIGEEVYEQRLEALTEPARIARARAAYARKFGRPATPPSEAPEIQYFAVRERDTGRAPARP